MNLLELCPLFLRVGLPYIGSMSPSLGSENVPSVVYCYTFSKLWKEEVCNREIEELLSEEQRYRQREKERERQRRRKSRDVCYKGERDRERERLREQMGKRNGEKEKRESSYYKWQSLPGAYDKGLSTLPGIEIPQ